MIDINNLMKEIQAKAIQRTGLDIFGGLTEEDSQACNERTAWVDEMRAEDDRERYRDIQATQRNFLEG